MVYNFIILLTFPSDSDTSGVAGLATYIYIDRSEPKVAPKKVQEKSPLDPNNFVEFKLKKVEPYNHNSAKYAAIPQYSIAMTFNELTRSSPIRYIFELPNGEASLLPIASCVVVKSASDAEKPLLGKNDKPIIRPYTPISPSDAEGELTFLIKRYEEGKMSQYIHNLKPGEKLAIKGPIIKIPYEGTSQ